MKVLMVEPGKAPYEAELDGSLESMQEAVGGGIEGYYPYAEPVAIVCNDEGKINGLPLNRAIYNRDGEMIEIMAGTFFMAGLGEESFTDLPDYLMEQYREQFRYPEKFFKIAGEIVAAKQPLPPEEKEQPAPVMDEPDENDIRLDESTDLAFDLDEFFRQNSGSYAGLYPDPHAEKERMADELLSGSTGKIRMRIAAFEQEEHMEGEAAPLMERVAAYEKEFGIKAYSVYQLEHSDSMAELRFMNQDWLDKKGLSADRENYKMVYSGIQDFKGEQDTEDTLELIYEHLNLCRPEGYQGYSLSVSDVVVLHDGGTDRAYYVDSVGFRELPDFFGAGTPEAERGVSVREQLDSARKQAVQAEPKAPDKKNKEPERS